MRTITYTCDRCGKQISSRNVTKLNIVLYRGLDSTEKKSCDFCSHCFLKMKKAWKHELSETDDKSVKTEEKPVIDELAKTQELLYIPSEHEEISSFINEDLRRYIWHGVYAATSILFSDTYEQKTLLVNYDESQSDGNYSYREVLYVVKDSPYISIPFGGYYNIKNKFWDLTKCAKALDKYNKEHKIYTEDLKYEEQET